MGDKIKLRSKDDLDDNYSPSETEDEYSEEEKQLLANVRRNRNDDSGSEENVYAFSESESDNADIADSDIEGKGDQDDDLPNEKAWGKKKKSFYHTDYVDEDYGGFGKDEEIALLEEQEAKKLQKRLTEQLGDEDFSLDLFTKSIDKDKGKKSETEILVKSDLSQLSKRQKLQLLKKELPEFSGLVNDFKEKITLTSDILKPVIDLIKEKNVANFPATDFLITYYENHPVTKRLSQYKQILNQIEPIFDESMRPQLEDIISAIANNELIEVINGCEEKHGIKRISNENLKYKSKKLKLLNNLIQDVCEEKDENIGEIYAENNESMSSEECKNEQSNVTESNQASFEEMPLDGLDGEKRAITYQMAKNKGLTPRRKKEQRNPRVKHRNKYRKAKIKRKGAIREVRTELNRYDGELSGIKTNVKKSIKIK